MILNYIEGIYFLMKCSAFCIGLYPVYVFMFKCHGSSLTLSADCELYKNSATKTEVFKFHIKAWGSLLQLEFFSDFYIKIWYFKNYSCCVWVPFLSCWTISVDKTKSQILSPDGYSSYSHDFQTLSQRLLRSPQSCCCKDKGLGLSPQKKAKRQREDFCNSHCTGQEGAEGEEGAKYIASGISLPSLATIQTQPLFKWQYLLYVWLPVIHQK